MVWRRSIGYTPLRRLHMKTYAVVLALFVLAPPALGQTYKCKTQNGSIEISDQPCRGSSVTSRVVETEHISESQRRSSTDWLNRGAARLERQAQADAAAQREAERQESIRQAAARQEMQRQQEERQRQQMILEMQRAQQEAAEAKRAARRAEEAANNAAESSSRPQTGSCKVVGNRCYY